MATEKASKKSAAAKKHPAKAKAKTEASRPKEDESASKESHSLVGQLLGLSSQVASGAVDIARSGIGIPLSFTDKMLRDAYMKTMDIDRIKAMSEAGNLLKDAREVAGLNIVELAEAVGLTDSELLEEVEEGRAILPIDTLLRIASLTARHDPIPFVLKFLRTYSPDLEQTLEQWGIIQLPKKYERERRFANIYKSLDSLRGLSDAEFERFIGYMKASTKLTMDIMQSEQRKQQGKSEEPEAEDGNDTDTDTK
jgi:transcriptional regulator with XRE-family HTH domain